MVKGTLRNQLIQSFSEENLHEITLNLIEYKKQNNQHALQEIAKIINDFKSFNWEDNSKRFSRLIILFHPDKLKEYQKLIIKTEQAQVLQELMYIIPVLEFIHKHKQQNTSHLLSPGDFEEEYGWNYQPTESDYYMVREEDDTFSQLYDEENPEEFAFIADEQFNNDGSFLDAVKRKIYGPTSIDFPVNLLADLEEIEMAEYDVENIEGIEFCTHLKVLDLSYNNVFDINLIAHCKQIQELYLSNNQIHYIDALYQLRDLRILDLSDNRVEDLSALMQLKNLEFVNLMGNSANLNQVMTLRKLGVVVVL